MPNLTCDFVFAALAGWNSQLLVEGCGCGQYRGDIANIINIFLQTLPSFSSAHSQIGNNTDGFYINSQSGFALPPLENTFNFENVDLEDSPAWK